LRYAIGFLDTAREQHLAQVARAELTEIESDCLQMILKKGSDWRERNRAMLISVPFFPVSAWYYQPLNQLGFI
jgi:hypothetical protein